MQMPEPDAGVLAKKARIVARLRQELETLREEGLWPPADQGPGASPSSP